MNDQIYYDSRKKSPGLSFVLALFIPGVSYWYCGRPLLSFLVWFMMLVIAIPTVGIGLLVMYPIILIDSVFCAQRYNRQLADRLAA